MTAILSNRQTRRRAIAYALLLAAALGLMAFSSSPPLQELQRGIGFAFRPFQSAVNEVAKSVSSVVGSIAEIDRLRRDNDALKRENEELKADNGRYDAIRRENEQLTALLQLRNSLTFETVAAGVIGRESSEYRRVMTIDRGSNDSVKVGDVAIAAGGALAGRVVEVGPTFAHILLINDTTSTVVGSDSTTGAAGEVVGQLGGALVMRNIDATDKLAVNEEVTTAGIELNGGVRSPFPKGLLIGQVVDITREPNSVVQTAYVRPAADLDRLEYVLVITNYQGGLPAPGDQPLPCGSGPGNTLPGGETPCYTPTPAPQPSASRPASPRPSATPYKTP